MYISIEVYRGDDNSFIAMCPELNLSSSGNTEDQAVERLKKEIIFSLYSDKGKDARVNVKETACFYVDGEPKVH